MKIENDILDTKAAQFNFDDDEEVDDIDPHIESLGKKNEASLKFAQDALKIQERLYN